MGQLSVQIGGKFSITDVGIFTLKQALVEAGVTVAHPRGDAVIASAGGMALSIDLNKHKMTLFELEIDYFRSIGCCAVHIVHNKVNEQIGYIGESAAVEIGYAVLAGRPVCVLYPPVYAPSVPIDIAELLRRKRERLIIDRIDTLRGDNLRNRISELAATEPKYSLIEDERRTICCASSRLLKKYRRGVDSENPTMPR